MANINVRIDGQVKANAERVFASLGLTPTAAIALFYHQVIRTNSIPFALKADMPNEETEKALEEMQKMEAGDKEVKTFATVDDLMEDLLE